MAAQREKSAKRQRFTRHERETAYQLIADNATLAVISKAIGSSPKTVKRHFADQLEQRSRGRPERVWTHEERKLVSVVIGIGVAHADVARMVGLSVVEFRAAFVEEIVAAKSTVDAAIGSRIVEQALGGDAQLLRFYARSKMNWNDRPAVDSPTLPGQAQAAILRPMIEALNKEGRAGLRIALEQMGAVGTATKLSKAGPTEADTVN